LLRKFLQSNSIISKQSFAEKFNSGISNSLGEVDFWLQSVRNSFKVNIQKWGLSSDIMYIDASSLAEQNKHLSIYLNSCVNKLFVFAWQIIGGDKWVPRIMSSMEDELKMIMSSKDNEFQEGWVKHYNEIQGWWVPSIMSSKDDEFQG